MFKSGSASVCRQCSPSNEKLLLVWDSFRGHLTSEESPSSSTIDVTVIPGGLTLVLQPLNRCLNKPFKENVR